MKKLLVLLIGLGLLLAGCEAKHDDGHTYAPKDTERVAKLAMSTASMWMIAHHVHEIEESIEIADMEEAVEETEELFEWLKGAIWIKELQKPSDEMKEVTSNLLVALRTKNEASIGELVEKLDEAEHELHHELMEIVGEGHKSSDSKESGSHGH